MSDFFYGWRRKAGCVTLVMATVFAGGWIWSYSPTATFEFCSVRVALTGGYIRVDQYVATTNIMMQHVERTNIADGSVDQVLSKMIVSTDDPQTWEVSSVFAPFWSMAVPLTLLSAYLILWKPQKREFSVGTPDAFLHVQSTHHNNNRAGK